MQNHYNLLYREEEREMFPTLNVRLCRFSIYVDVLISTHLSILALVRFLGLLLLAVFLHVLWEMMILSAQRVMGMDIDLGFTFLLKLSLLLLQIDQRLQ